jgi:hypothetical protein
MNKKKVLGISLIVVGLVIGFSNFNINGAVIGPGQTNSFSLIAAAFLVGGLLILLRGNLEGKVYITKDEDGKPYVHSKQGNLSLAEIREYSSDPELKKDLRGELFSGLIKSYVSSKNGNKKDYLSFLSALSPRTSESQLHDRLGKAEVAYQKINDEKNRDGVLEFSPDILVRFENERDNPWPSEGEIGELPFDWEKVNVARGPRYSVVPKKTLIHDGYLLQNGNLNPKWSKQQRQNYLRDSFGIDKGSRQRKMISFQLEGNSAEMEDFGHYKNIKVKRNKTPKVKILNKKKF